MLSWRGDLVEEKGPDVGAWQANLHVIVLLLSAAESLKCYTTSQQKEVGGTYHIEIVMGLRGHIGTYWPSPYYPIGPQQEEHEGLPPLSSIKNHALMLKESLLCKGS